MKRVCGLMLFWRRNGNSAFYPGNNHDDIVHHRLYGTGIQLILLVKSVCWKRERCADTRFQLK